MDTTGQLHVWTDIELTIGVPVLMACVDHIVLGTGQHRDLRSGGVSRCLETVEVLVTTGAVAALMGTSCGHHHVRSL